MRRASMFLAVMIATSSRAVPQTPPALPEEHSIQELRRVLPQALAKLEQSYANIRGTIVRVDKTNYNLIPESVRSSAKFPGAYKGKRGEHLVESSEVSFAATDKFRRCEVTSVKHGDEGDDRDTGQKPAFKSVFCVGPRGSFALTWDAKDATPQLRSFTLDEGNPSQRYHNLVSSFLNSSFTLPFKKLADLLNDDAFHVTETRRVDVDGRSCVRVGFNYRTTPDPKTAAKKTASMLLVGSFTADPAIGWALRSWEYSTPGTTRSVAVEIDYQTQEDGTVYPSKVLYTSDKARKNLCTFQRIVPERTKDSDFTLTYYGLPELDRPIGDLSASSIPLWIGGISLLF